ncbi:NAD(P)-binding protein [Fistulina hepatica ATCC 64428]|uniref:NAD(P)-binding protein n=1 Tax=Fistulina hepatica ATCC 64428 TaxID=1128425 RepID=A0A0D6ZZH3_9AGAR|nr:NAD(P)-binding protein [Fistulina hepatica ATCC 64428]
MAPSSFEPVAYPTLQGKVAIVTGASRGIGASIAYELARRGADVMVTYTSATSDAKADAIVEQIRGLKQYSGRAAKICCDLRQPGSPKKIVDATLAAFSVDHIDILVNNAGVFTQLTLDKVTLDDYAQVYDVNVRAPILMAQAVLPYLGKRSRIINLSSIGGRIGRAGVTLYCSSKAALEGFTRALAGELGVQGHTVNAIAAGPVDTDMMAQSGDSLTETMKALTPLEHRVAEPVEIAVVVVGLCEDAGRWITGQTISASGGLQML